MTATPTTLPVQRFDPTPCGFPPPRVPVLPPLHGAQLQWASNHLPTEVRHFSRGRYALLAAYRLAGVGPGGALLAPAYHCLTMLDPALRLGAEVSLYALTPTLAPELDGLRHAIVAARTPVKALLLTHYFGLPQDAGVIRAVLELCDAHGIRLIEDCSHALAPDAAAGSATASGRIGRIGHYAVSSPYKFFPCPDGGLLWRNHPAVPLPVQARAPGLKPQLRALRQAMRTPGTNSSLASDASAIARELESVMPRAGVEGLEWQDDAAGLSAEYQVADEAIGSAFVSRWIQRHVDVDSLRAARRKRYAQWLAAMADVPGARPLWPQLPDRCTPYMFPLLVERPHARFYPLKQLGVPIWRWDDMAVSSCPVASTYRQGVFHLPCHQALSDAQMAWLAATVAHVLAET